MHVFMFYVLTRYFLFIFLLYFEQNKRQWLWWRLILVNQWLRNDSNERDVRGWQWQQWETGMHFWWHMPSTSHSVIVISFTSVRCHTLHSTPCKIYCCIGNSKTCESAERSSVGLLRPKWSWNNKPSFPVNVHAACNRNCRSVLGYWQLNRRTMLAKP